MEKLIISSKPKLLSLIALFLVLATKQVQSQETDFSFDSFNPKPSDLIYQDDTHVVSGSTSLRLTGTDSTGKPEAWSTGRVLYSTPVTLWDGVQQASFEVTIRFVITPSSGGAADGITFFIAPVNTTFSDNTSGESLGVFDYTSGTKPSTFAVEFDTYDNTFDPGYLHIGIDLESRVSKSTTQFNSGTGQVVIATINYDPATHTISVAASSGSQTASLSYVYDLRTILPQQVQLGLSSSSGLTTSNLGVADIISWYFTSSIFYGDHIHQVV